MSLLSHNSLNDATSSVKSTARPWFESDLREGPALINHSVIRQSAIIVGIMESEVIIRLVPTDREEGAPKLFRVATMFNKSGG